MTPVRARARRGEGDRLRDEILEAVSVLLDETNDESAVSIRAIAERVGVTPPSIYRHFADKEALLSAVCSDVFDQLVDGMALAVTGATTPLDALAEAGRCYIEFGLAHPEHYRLVFMRPPLQPMDVDHGELRAVVESGEIPESHPLFSGDALAGSLAYKGLHDLVASVLADVSEPDCPDVGTMTDVFWAAVHGITSLRISKPDFAWPSVEEMVDGIVWPWRQLLHA